MSKRLFFFFLPVMSCVAAVFAACQDDPSASSSPDAGVDGAVTPPPGMDSAVPPPVDAGFDTSTPVVDAGFDATPPLCATYPNAFADAGPDATVGEANKKFWDLIALRTLDYVQYTCEIGEYFDTTLPPLADDCFARQLLELTGCTNTSGQPIQYAGSSDKNGTACLPAVGTKVQLGFQDPPRTAPAPARPTVKDVDFFIEEARKNAIRGGMSVADADRLKALLVAKRNLAVGSDGGDYSQSICE